MISDIIAGLINYKIMKSYQYQNTKSMLYHRLFPTMQEIISSRAVLFLTGWIRQDKQ